MTTILYVEDNFQNFRLVMRMVSLDHPDYKIIHAEDGESGLRLATESRPDLIFMDINLPDMDGTEVTRRIKAHEDLNKIPVIALTANAMVGDRERYLEAGCDGYLRKPLSRDELRQTMANYFGPPTPAS
jgi:two-component system, cell cycle response regulator DivK